MHILDANEIFWTTFYTYDRIMDLWWKNWPDAFALYVKYIKQSRIQETNQTRTLNSFLRDWLKRTDERLKKARDVLKDLWLIDDIVIRDELWKIKWHYVRVNFLINEDKIRNSSSTYNLSTTPEIQGLDNPDCGKSETNALSNININALSTQDKNILSKDNISKAETTDETQTFLNSLPVAVEKKEKSSAKKERKEYWDKDINHLIRRLKDECDGLNIAYDKTDDRMFAYHILTGKEYWEFCEKIQMSREWFAVFILNMSNQKQLYTTACAWPKSIYQNYPKVFNMAKKMYEKTTPVVLDDL